MDAVITEVRACATPSESARVQMEQRIKAALASTPIEKVLPSEITCLWKIQAKNGVVMYADWTGRYLIQGAVIDLNTGTMLETKTTGFSNE